MGDSILADPSDDTFRNLQGWVAKSKKLLWVSASSMSDETYPYTGLKDGLLRVIRSETRNRIIFSITIEDDSHSPPIGSDYEPQIAQVFRTAFETETPDFEYVVRDGQVLTGRLILESSLNQELNSSIQPQMSQEPWLPGPPLLFDVGARGSLDTICFVEDQGAYVAPRQQPAVDLRHLYYHRPVESRRPFGKTMSLVEEGVIHCPRPSHTFPMSATEGAFRFLQRGKNRGRVIIRADHDAQVQKHLIKRRRWTFDANATYLVSGGLGGVGRSILRWMASKGAKQLLVPTRSGAASDEAKQVVRELTEQGVTIDTPRCDVSVASSLQGMLEDHANTTMDPVRGCINASMVLHDTIFENMTAAQWRATVCSKASAPCAPSTSSATGPCTTRKKAALFRAATTEDERTGVVLESLAQKLARGLSDVDVKRPLHLYGVDSLVALELRNWIGKEFAADVPVFELMSGRTVLAIGQMVSRSSQVKLTAVF
ncbi:hypothetical protein PG984_011970 [Apiospora sp. TS-2023a]